MPTPPYKRSQGSIGQSSHGNHNNFGGNGSKGASATKSNWGQPKDVKANLKSPVKSCNSDKKIKYEKAASCSKSYDSWNKAKANLTENEFNKRRRANACINCGEIGHKFFNCPKPKPGLLESVIDSTVPITRTLIPEMSSVINESCVIKSNSNYRIDSIEHRFKRCNCFEPGK